MAHYASGAPVVRDQYEKEAVPEGCFLKLLLWFRRNAEVVAWIVVFEIIGVLIGTTSNVTGEWYTGLVKSPLNPPPQIFGVAWPILYLLLAIAGYQIFTAPEGSRKGDLLFPFAIQQILNWVWNPVFFNLEAPEVALIIVTVIATLTGMIFVGLVKLKAWEAFLILPYFLWLLFATHLNTYILRNNC